METFDHDLANYQNKYLSDTDDLCECGNEIDHEEQSPLCMACADNAQDEIWFYLADADKLSFSDLISYVREYFLHATQYTDEELWHSLRGAFNEYKSNQTIAA